MAPVSKDGAATWFETPCTRPRNLGRSKVAATMRPGETASASNSQTGVPQNRANFGNRALADEASFLSKEIKRGQQRQAEDREMIRLDTLE